MAKRNICQLGLAWGNKGRWGCRGKAGKLPGQKKTTFRFYRVIWNSQVSVVASKWLRYRGPWSQQHQIAPTS